MNWISVNDRYPETRGTYLVARKGKRVKLISEFACSYFFGGSIGVKKWKAFQVTHWMPIPAVPQGGDNAQ